MSCVLGFDFKSSFRLEHSLSRIAAPTTVIGMQGAEVKLIARSIIKYDNNVKGAETMKAEETAINEDRGGHEKKRKHSVARGVQGEIYFPSTEWSHSCSGTIVASASPSGVYQKLELSTRHRRRYSLPFFLCLLWADLRLS